MQIMDPSEFVRAYGNLTVKTLSIVFPGEWVEAAWRVIEPPERMVLAIEVNDEPAGGCISSGHLTEDGGVGVRTLDWRYGSPRWIPGLVDEMIQKRTVEAVVADFGGPARAIQAEITAVCDGRNVPLMDRSPRDLAADTGGFYDSLREGSVALEKAPPLADAIGNAHRKDIGDLWLVSRKRMTVDASPLIAGIMAHGVAKELGVFPVVSAFVL
jgi:hypothetical protein